MPSLRFPFCFVCSFAVLFSLFLLAEPALAQTETVLYNFQGGADGGYPHGDLIFDAQGNLYGTTAYGGAYGLGTVFELTPSGTETVLHSFHPPLSVVPRGSLLIDGVYPQAGLVMDAQGNLYGTTRTFYTGCVSYDCGSVFRVTPTGAEKTLYSFPGKPDGVNPSFGSLILDDQGNLYGTTTKGGAYDWGTVFMVTPSGAEKVLYSFAGGADGVDPIGGLIRDAQGNLYGTTSGNYGTVFKLAPDGTKTVLYTFTGHPDGEGPQAGLVSDAQGNLYGTTSAGGIYNCGAVFKVTPSGTGTVLHSFRYSPPNNYDGLSPQGGLVMDAQGNLYGTTVLGGNGGYPRKYYKYGGGTVFKLTPDGTETLLYSFCSKPWCADGGFPAAGLVFDTQGNLYGTTSGGGVNYLGGQGSGTVFKLTP